MPTVYNGRPHHLYRRIDVKLAILPACALLLATSLAHAGPNWQAIETARQEKEQGREVAAEQHKRHQTSMEKLKAACDKAQDNAEVRQACEEMMAACHEMM